jgi:hypothetical protein
MDLPIEIDFDPPTRADVRRWLRALRSWRGVVGIAVVAGAISGGVSLYRHFTEPKAPSVGGLSVASIPHGAFISIDGQPRGQTPAALSIAAGRHTITLGLPGYAALRVPVEIQAGRQATVRRELWPAHASLLPVRPPLPGSRIDATAFQDDGSVALDVELSTDEHQLWLLDAQGSYREVGTSVHGSIALSSDGQALAFVDAQSSGTLTYAMRNAVWLSDPGDVDRRHLAFALSGDQAMSQITSLSWAPGTRQLLVVAEDQAAGGRRSRLIVLSDDQPPRQLIAIPATVIDGSETWSPDGRQVAFLAKAGSRTSLCLLDVDDGGFRYLADTGGTSDQLPVAEVTWAPDGSRVFFTAEEAGQSAVAVWPFAGSPAARLYATAAGGGPIRQFSPAGLRSPLALTDGTLLGFVRGKGGNVFLDAADQEGPPEPVAGIGLQREHFAARWDARRHQAVLVAGGSFDDGSDRLEMWLARFTPGGQA